MSIYDNVASGGAPAPAADDMVVPDYAPSSSKPMESMGGGGGDMSASASSGGGKMGGGVADKLGAITPKQAGIAAAVVVAVVLAVVLLTRSGGGDAGTTAYGGGSGSHSSYSASGQRGFVTGRDRFVTGPTPVSWPEAKAYCEKTYPNGGMASIHSYAEQRSAASACQDGNIGTGWGDLTRANGCWIGLNDVDAQSNYQQYGGNDNYQNQNGIEMGFKWTDGTPVDFIAFAAGEPNECAGDEQQGEAHCTQAGEDYVEMHVGYNFGWNDNAAEGSYTHNVINDPLNAGIRGMYPLCEKTRPVAVVGTQAATTWQAPKPACADGQDPLAATNQGVAQCVTMDQATQSKVYSNFAVLASPNSAVGADEACKSKGFYGLASLHSVEDIKEAAKACKQVAKQHRFITGLPHGCWIGLTDQAQQPSGTFNWMDGTAVEYLNWAPGEPNNWGARADNVGKGSAEGEAFVEMDWRAGDRGGAWNDNHNLGQAGHMAQGDMSAETVNACYNCFETMGHYPLCEIKRPHANMNGPWQWATLTKAEVGRFVALPDSYTLANAAAFCDANYAGLASIHSMEEQRQASQACRQVASVDAEWQHGIPEGCWIGLTDDPTLGSAAGVVGVAENRFSWLDNTPVNYLNWNGGEPNACTGCGGENGVEIDYRWGNVDGYEFGGGWNDANDYGRAGGDTAWAQERMAELGVQAAYGADPMSTIVQECWGCFGAVGYFPLCQTRAPDPAVDSYNAMYPTAPTFFTHPDPVRVCTATGQAPVRGYGTDPTTGQQLPIEDLPHTCPGAGNTGYVPPPPPPQPLPMGTTYSAFRFHVTHVRDPSLANSVQYSELQFFDRDAHVPCNVGGQPGSGCRVYNAGGSNPMQRRTTCVHMPCTTQCTADLQDPGKFTCMDRLPDGQSVPVIGNVGECNQQTQTKEVCAGGLGSELPEMAVDGNPNTKFLDFNHGQASAGGPHGSTRAASDLMVWFPRGVRITSYTFVTANDAPERDPSSWLLQGCAAPCVPSPESMTCPDGCTSGDWITLDSRASYDATNDVASQQAGGALHPTVIVGADPGIVQVSPGRLKAQKHFKVGNEYAEEQDVNNGGHGEHPNRQFVAFPYPQTYDKARTYCKRHLGGFAELASIHTEQHQMIAKTACQTITSEDFEGGLPHSCWIGFRRAERDVSRGSKDQFSWTDGSTVEFVAWAPGEPNDTGDNGEDAVEIDCRGATGELPSSGMSHVQAGEARSNTGYWNDNALEGEAGHGMDMAGCYGCYGAYGMYPLCQTHSPDGSGTGGGTTTIFGQQIATSGVGKREGYHQVCQIRPGVNAGYTPQGSPVPPQATLQGCVGTFDTCCIDPHVDATGTHTTVPVNCPYNAPACVAPGLELFGQPVQQSLPYCTGPQEQAACCCPHVPGQGRRQLAETAATAHGLAANPSNTSAAMSGARAVTGNNGTKTVWVDSALPADSLRAELAAQFGSVVYSWGCTHSHALNYNPKANMEAGNCEYAPNQPHSWMQ